MTIWGTSAGYRSPLSGLAEWERIDDEIAALNGGFRHQARRSYGQDIYDDIVGTTAEDDIGERVSVYSMRPAQPGNAGWQATLAGDHDAAIQSFVQSVPGGHKMYLCYNHEPENDGGTAANFRKACARFMQIVLDEGNTNVVPAFNLMGYTWQTSSRNPWDWNPGRHLSASERAASVGSIDAYGLNAPTTRTPSFLFTKPYGDIVTNWGFRFGIFECGVDDVAGRDTWMQALETWVNARSSVDVVCWWHSVVDGYPSTWLDGDDHLTDMTAWADIIAANQSSSVPGGSYPAVTIPAAATASPTNGTLNSTPTMRGGQSRDRLFFVGRTRTG